MEDKELVKIVGRDIATRRRALGMTQETLATILEIAPDTLSRMENGRFAPKMTRLRAIANALNCNVSDLFRTADLLKDTDEQVANLPEAFAALLKPLSDETQKDLLQLMICTAKILHK